MRRPITVVLLGLAALTVACGVPEDDHPQELSSEEVPFGLLTTPTTTSVPETPPDARSAILFFLEAPDRLASLTRELESSRPSTVLETLVSTTSADLESGFTTAIPPGTEVLDVDVDDQVLTIDLSEEFSSIQGEGAIAAVAQIVFTATELPGVHSVAFQVEGEDIQVSDQTGAQQDEPVTRFDYATLSPST